MPLEVLLPLEGPPVGTLWEITPVHALGYPGEVHHPVPLAKFALLHAVQSRSLQLDILEVDTPLGLVVVMAEVMVVRRHRTDWRRETAIERRRAFAVAARPGRGIVACQDIQREGGVLSKGCRVVRLSVGKLAKHVSVGGVHRGNVVVHLRIVEFHAVCGLEAWFPAWRGRDGVVLEEFGEAVLDVLGKVAGEG